MVLPMLSAQLEEFARQGSEMNNKPVLRPDPKETEAGLCQIGAAPIKRQVHIALCARLVGPFGPPKQDYYCSLGLALHKTKRPG